MDRISEVTKKYGIETVISVKIKTLIRSPGDKI